MDVSELMLRFKTDGEEGAIRALDQVDREIKQVDQSAQGAGMGIKGMLGAAAGFAIAGGIVSAAGGLLMLNANAEQARMSLETVTGSAANANALFADLQAFAAATPFAFPELVTSAINLEAFGLKTNDWIGTIGDTASAMGKSVDQVTQAVLDAQTAQYERLKELGIMANVKGDEVTFTYQKNGETIRETVDRYNQDVINSTIQGIWNEKYAGAMEKQSQSFIGQWSTLKDNASITMMSATEGVFTATRGLLSFANDVFAVGWQQAIDNAFGDSTFGTALSNIGDFAGAIVDSFGEGSSVADIVETLPEDWQGFAEPVLTFFDSFGDTWSKFRSEGVLAGVGQFASELKTLAESGAELGGVVISGTWELAGDLAGSAWDKIKAAVYGVTADPTGGPNAPALSREIPVGKVLVSIAELGIKTISGWAEDATTSVQTWLDTNELSGFTQAIRIDAFDPVFADIAVSDYGAAVHDAITADPIQVTPEVEVNIQLGFENWARDAKTRVGEMDWSDVGEIFKIGMIAGLAVVNLPAVIGTWFTVTAGPDIIRAGRAALFGVLDGLFTGEDYFDQSSGRMMQGESLLQGWSDGLAQWLNETPGEIWDDLKEALTPDFSGLSAPNMPEWMTNTTQWLDAPVQTLVDGIEGAVTLVREAWNKLLFWQSEEGKGFATNTGSNTVGGGMGLNLIPRTWLNEQINGPQAPTAGGANPNWLPEAQPLVAKLGIDSSAFDKGLENATGDMTNWGNLVEKAKLGADNGQAAKAYTDAFNWGSIWDGATFSATFSINTAPMYTALSVVRGIAQEISDLLPNSPAKKGPLARMPSFGYVADAMERDLGRLPGIAARHLGVVAPGLSPSRYAGAAVAGGPPIYIDMSGAFIGSGARAEVQSWVEQAAGKKAGRAVTSRQIEDRR